MLNNFYKFAILPLIVTICSVYGQTNLNVKAKVEPYSIPYGHYHCYLRIVASCFNETKANMGDDYDDPTFCVGYLKTSYFYLSPPINCDHNDLKCWKTCNNRFKNDEINKSTEPNLSTPILNNVSYASHVTKFNPTTLNVTWSPVKGAYLYVIQYLNKIDTYSNWEVGSGRPLVTSKTYVVFEKESVCSKIMFRVAAISINHVGQFSKIMESPDDYPSDFYMKLNFVEINYTKHAVDSSPDKDFKNKLEVNLSYNMPAYIGVGGQLEQVYLRTKDNAYVELKKQALISDKFFISYAIPTALLNSGNELLFVRESFRDPCLRQIKANTAVKIKFSCDNDSKSVPCNRRTYFNLTGDEDPFMAKINKNRQVIKLEEPYEIGVSAILKKFRQQINVDDYQYTGTCNIEPPSKEPIEVIILKNYQSISYCGIPPTTGGLSPLIVNEKSDVDFMVTSKVYTINKNKCALMHLLTIAIVFLSIIFTLSIVGISYLHFKRESNKYDHVVRNEKVNLP